MLQPPEQIAPTSLVLKGRFTSSLQDEQGLESEPVAKAHRLYDYSPPGNLWVGVAGICRLGLLSSYGWQRKLIAGARRAGGSEGKCKDSTLCVLIVKPSKPLVLRTLATSCECHPLKNWTRSFFTRRIILALQGRHILAQAVRPGYDALYIIKPWKGDIKTVQCRPVYEYICCHNERW